MIIQVMTKKKKNKKNWCDCFQIKMLVTFHPYPKCVGMYMQFSLSVNCELIVAEHETLKTHSIIWYSTGSAS